MGQMRWGLFGFIAAWALTWSGPVWAASCEPTLFPQDLAAVRTGVVTAGRAPVFLDPEACSRPTGLCPTRAYLVHGDRVLAAQAADGWRCVAFVGPKRLTIGWVKDDAVAPVPESQPPVSWAGAWSRANGDATARIARTDKGYRAVIEAFAHGADPTNVRTGGAQGVLTVQGSSAVVHSEGAPTCTVSLRLIGEQLVVNDGANDNENSPCGGVGVTMNGVYRRR